MTQRLVLPQAQSLCATVQVRHVQNSHQIHLRWFTSRTKRATIQSRISVCDTLSNVSAVLGPRKWAGRPVLGRPGSYAVRVIGVTSAARRCGRRRRRTG